MAVMVDTTSVDFRRSARADALVARMEAFVHEDVEPAEARYRDEMAAAGDPHALPPVLDELKERARELELWNLFLTESNEDYAPIAELSGRSLWLAPEAMNCSPPDAGNMELLTRFGTAEQQERWLRPLLEAEIRSCFAMTEPDVASSEATNISLRIERDGDEYVLDGRKWWITGAADPRCRVALVLGRTDPSPANRHRAHSVVLVPMDSAGLTIVRDQTTFGYNDREGHCELRFDGVRVPVTNVLGEEGAGFEVAQARLGPGRIHHCMRMVGAAERALELLCRRVQRRHAWGGPLADQGVIREWIAESRIDIEQSRLLTLKAAWMIDQVGTKGARTEIAAIQVAVPRMAARVIDRAIQAHGGAGVGDDLPLAAMYVQARWLRIGDGPDEVHLRQLGRDELARYREEEQA
jgi:acyl-CoA dehydrogenase